MLARHLASFVRSGSGVGLLALAQCVFFAKSGGDSLGETAAVRAEFSPNRQILATKCSSATQAIEALFVAMCA